VIVMMTHSSNDVTYCNTVILCVSQFCTSCQQRVSDRLVGNVVSESDGVNSHCMSSFATTATEHSTTTQQVTTAIRGAATL